MTGTERSPLETAIADPRRAVHIVKTGDAFQVTDGAMAAGHIELPPIFPEWLGDRSFQATHGCKFAYVVGEMARGIATPRMVIAAVKTGAMGFYGSAGLDPDTVAGGLTEIQTALGPDAPAWGANLIHTPQQPGYEAAIVDLFLSRKVRRVSASAFMGLSKEVVRYALAGLSRGADGSIVRSTHVFAKVSRAEVARQFLAPAPEKMVQELVAAGQITAEQAELSRSVAVAEDITAESDSGGHTDNRPAGPLFASLSRASAETSAKHGTDANRIRIGLAGGIATPHAAAAAFQMGAAYVLTGSINQSAVESGLAEPGRQMLANAGPADVIMAPAADMFEQGVKVQVLKRGTLFGPRGNRMWELYRTRNGFADFTADEQRWFEDVLGEPYAQAWAATRAYLETANPREMAQGDADPAKQFALVVRRYLFQGAQWAREGVEARKADFQIWNGPAMGAFNEWVAGTFLEPAENRTVEQIALNIMEGAACLTRAHTLRSAGVAVPPALFDLRPVRLKNSTERPSG